jgi:hypothetical protein
MFGMLLTQASARNHCHTFTAKATGGNVADRTCMDFQVWHDAQKKGFQKPLPNLFRKS